MLYGDVASLWSLMLPYPLQHFTIVVGVRTVLTMIGFGEVEFPRASHFKHLLGDKVSVRLSAAGRRSFAPSIAHLF